MNNVRRGARRRTGTKEATAKTPEQNQPLTTTEVGLKAAYIKEALAEKLVEHKRYFPKDGEDMTENRNCRWKGKSRSRRMSHSSAMLI